MQHHSDNVNPKSNGISSLVVKSAPGKVKDASKGLVADWKKKALSEGRACPQTFILHSNTQ